MAYGFYFVDLPEYTLMRIDEGLADAKHRVLMVGEGLFDLYGAGRRALGQDALGFADPFYGALAEALFVGHKEYLVLER